MLVDEPMVSFTALDRCDRCGAQAYYQADKTEAAAELLFCAHHHREFETELLNQGWTIRKDEEGAKVLAVTPGGSAW